jgi:hypothetical protein
MPTKSNPGKMSSEENKIKTKELVVNELRVYYDRINQFYDSRRLRAIVFLGGGFTTLGYLFSDGSFIYRIFRSGDVTKIIFFSLGMLLLVMALIALFVVIRPVFWASSVDTDDIKKMEFTTYVDFLDYLKKEYLDALKINRAHHQNKQWFFDFGSFLLIIGAVLLIVIKQFN